MALTGPRFVESIWGGLPNAIRVLTGPPVRGHALKWLNKKASSDDRHPREDAYRRSEASN
jgi:hypothetical protein